jgi:hypothetical protein
MAPFTMTRSFAGAFWYFHMKASSAGDYRILEVRENTPRAEAANLVLMTKGGCSYTSSNPQVPVHTVMAGETSEHLPDFVVDETFKVEALTDDTEFFCVNRKGNRPFSSQKFSVLSGETLIVPKGSCLLLGGGEILDGAAPLIIEVAESDFLAKAVSDCFGLLMS